MSKLIQLFQSDTFRETHCVVRYYVFFNHLQRICMHFVFIQNLWDCGCTVKIIYPAINNAIHPLKKNWHKTWNTGVWKMSFSSPWKAFQTGTKPLEDQRPTNGPRMASCGSIAYVSPDVLKGNLVLKQLEKVCFLFCVFLVWVFPKIVVPQNGWFVMENPIKMGWFGGTTIFGNIHVFLFVSL